MMKKTMKKADGGATRNPPALGIPGKDKMARGPKRPGKPDMTRPGFPSRPAMGEMPVRKPVTGGPMQPVRPTMPTMPRAMPMRKAKGGMAKGKKK